MNQSIEKQRWNSNEPLNKNSNIDITTENLFYKSASQVFVELKFKTPTAERIMKQTNILCQNNENYLPDSFQSH